MNKQELINRLEKLLTTPSEIEGYDFDDGYDFGVEHAIALAKDLDDPVIPQELGKPVVPQFVADWYEERKDYFDFNIYGFYKYFYLQSKHKEVKKWIDNAENKAIETLVKMKLFGYEVQKEKLYTVEIPNPNDSGYSKIYLAKNKDGKVELFTWSGYTSIEFADNWKQEENAQLTESEIKKDFDWAWQFAEGVEELNE